MIFHIPIKSRTKNPSAGETCYIIPERPEYSVSSSVPLDIEGLHLTSYNKVGDKESYEYAFFETGIIQKLMVGEYGGLTVNTKYNNYILHSLSPQPDYFIEYEDVEVECDECGAKFCFKELQYGEYDDNRYDYYYSDKVCPKCFAWDCCELELEKEN